MILNAVVAGAIYSLIALGFTLIFGIARVVNFAHGEMYMLSAFLTYYFTVKIGLPYLLAVTLVPVGFAIIGVVLERFLFRPVRPSEVGTEAEFPTVVITLALSLILPVIAILFFGTSEKGVPSGINGVIRISNVIIPWERFIIVVIALSLFICLLIFIRRHKEGLALDAVAQDREAAVLQGIDLDRTTGLSFAIGMGLVAAAGGLLAPLYYVEPTIGPPALLKTFIIVILGGIGSISGTLLGGLLFGFIEVFGRVFLGGSFPLLISFMMVIVILIIRPKGLLGHD